MMSADVPVIACNLGVFCDDQRLRYRELLERIRAAIRDRAEVSDGYVFRLDGEAIALAEVGEWIGMERLCCPFLSFQLGASGSEDEWMLTLTGPEGVRQVLNVAFGVG